jgi:UDP-N-acetylmuramate--alanine ligase
MSLPARRIHIVGVGGPGTSAIAVILREMGHAVSGSDVRESAVLDKLRRVGVRVNVPHDGSVVHGCDIVTYSAAVPLSNVEVHAARSIGVEVKTRAEMLGWICARHDTIAVAGTHGKTTTTTLLALMLRAAGGDPGYLVGADVMQLPNSAHWGAGPFVIEADESDSSHRAIRPRATVLTNVDLDHLDEHGSFEGIVESFDTYLSEVPGPKVVCADDDTARRLAEKYGAITYGIANGDGGDAGSGRALHSRGHATELPVPDWQATDVSFVGGGSEFTVVGRGERHAVSLPLRGAHNVRNFLAAFAMAREYGVDAEVAIGAVRDFAGVHRRFEVRAHDGGAMFVDDYAHLPAEIAAVLAAVRAEPVKPRQVIAVFQPNRFNRMAVMSDSYRDAFVDADLVVVTDIFASGTKRIEGVTGRLVVDAVLAAHPSARVEWCATRESLVDFVAREAGDGDVCISMGCGDIETFPDEVVARRRELSRGR